MFVGTLLAQLVIARRDPNGCRSWGTQSSCAQSPSQQHCAWNPQQRLCTSSSSSSNSSQFPFTNGDSFMLALAISAIVAPLDVIFKFFVKNMQINRTLRSLRKRVDQNMELYCDVDKLNAQLLRLESRPGKMFKAARLVKMQSTIDEVEVADEVENLLDHIEATIRCYVDFNEPLLDTSSASSMMRRLRRLTSKAWSHTVDEEWLQSAHHLHGRIEGARWRMQIIEKQLMSSRTDARREIILYQVRCLPLECALQYFIVLV